MFNQSFVTAFPDIHIHDKHVLADGDYGNSLVCSRLSRAFKLGPAGASGGKMHAKIRGNFTVASCLGLYHAGRARAEQQMRSGEKQAGEEKAGCRRKKIRF
jgi:hypothetical protein